MNLKFSKGLRGLPVLFLLILSFASLQVSAQNCTVNAGVPESICPGQKMVLKGVYTGLFTSTAVWSQVSGPAVTIGTPVISGSDITANVTGFSPGNTYTFRISARCQDGSQVFQDVVFTTLAATKATVGANITSCPGLVTLAGNAVGVNETGDWSLISRAYGMHINTSSSPTSTVTLPTDSTASAVFKWTIINTNGCASAAQMTVTNIGANPVISAGGNQTLGNCYNLTQGTQLGASYGGNGFMGQQGTWSFVSGPSTPSFGDIHNNRTGVSNLITGVYRLRWTVAGPCANGSAEMTITVPPPTQSVTNSGSANLIFCDSRTATVLNATIPGYTNEVGTWTVENGTATLSDTHAPSITVTNLVPPTFTRLRYTIVNSVTGCTTAGDFNITYSPQVSVAAINGPITVLPSTATAVSIPYTVTGGNQTLWQLVAGPLGATLAVSGITAYQNIDESPIDLTGLDKIGTYNFRLARVTNNAGQGGCENAFADLAVVISQPPTAANAGTSGAVACNVFTTTLAGNAPSTGSGYWSQVSGPSTVVFADIYDRATGISNLVAGSYTFRWIITGGYGAIDAQADVNVSVASAVPTIANAGPTQLVCNQTPIKLAGNTPALNETGTWTIAPVAGTFVNIHDPNTKLTGLADNSSYTLTWTIANSCGTSASTTTVTTSNTAGPKAAVAGSAQCLSSTATVFNLSGNAPSGLETGLWSLVSGPNSPSITSTSSNTTTVTGVVNGVYKFEWSLNTPTCTATRDTVIITASAAATVATVTTTPINLCNETVLTLAGNTPIIGTGKWTQVGGPGGAVITDPLSPTSTVTGLVAGSYIFRWTISNGSCSSNSADVKYNNSAPPVTPTVGIDQDLCGVLTTTLSGNVINPGQGLWKVVSGPTTPVFSSFTNPTASISGLATGVYKFIWTSSNGANCGISESRTLNVTVRANATASVASSGLCNATVAQLTGNNGSSGTWTFVSGSSIPTLTPNSNFTAIASNLINGSYTFKYTIPASGACVVTSSATVSINITASPSAAQAGIDQTLCSATFVTLAANAPAIGIGTWSIISQPGTGASFVNASSPTTNISTATPGVYLLQWNVTNGNCGTNQDIVRITTSAPPTTSVAGANQLTACSGNLTLIANTPSVGVGTWTQVTSMTGTIDAPNSAVSSVLGTIPGAYTFMWTIANGSCPASTSTVNITVSSIPPNLATPGPAQSICNVGATATATLAGSTPIGGETGMWTIASKPGGASPAFTDATLFNTTVTNLIQGEYQFTWTVSNGSCVSNSTVTITVTDQPTPAFAGADQSICLYTPVLLHATAVSVGVGTWSVTSQPMSTPTVVFSDVNSPTTDVNGLAAGDYIFTWITTNGSACATSMSNTTVHIVQPPTPALAGSFQTVCLGVNPVLTANSPTFGIGTWAVATSAGGTPAFSPSANTNNATVTGLVAGVYTFSWTITSGGCTSVDYMQVTVQPAIGNNQIETPQTICSGTTPAGLTGTIVTGGNGTTYNYQWQQSTTSNVAGFANIPSATAATFGPGSLTTTTWYRRLVSSGACTPGTFSNTLQITVQPPLANNVITAPITTTFCQTGDPDVITGLSATGGDGVTYNYQWEQSTTSAIAGFTAITGATSLDYDPATLTVSTWYRRTVTSGACAVITSTPTVKITINPYAALTSIQALTPICNGTTLTYSPTASIAGTTFAWTRAAIASINGNAAGSGTGIISQALTTTDVVPVPVTYLYLLTVTGCTNPIAYSITVNVNPTPVVTLPANQIVCNGTLTTAVVFAGSPVANTTYNWTNNTTSIGLAASGSGTINAFTATNSTNAPVTASITVTPVSNTCSGIAQTFTIVVNPTPLINPIAASICSGLTFTVTPTDPTNGRIPAGTTYAWGLPTGAASADGATATGASTITGKLTHTSNTALTAVYIVTPNTVACGDGPTYTVTITVNPVAAITDMTAITCGGVVFNVTPTQTTNGVVPSGTTYSWPAPVATGFSGGVTGTSQTNIRGTLTNIVSVATTATYIVTPVSGSCTGTAFTVTVSLLPKAIMSAQFTATTCSGVAFDFTPVNGFSGNILPAGTIFTWPTPTGTGLAGGLSQSTGIDHIFGTFVNTTNIARTATYSITPLSGLCIGNTYTVTATINPIVNIASTTQQFTRTICSGTVFTVSPVNGTNGIVPAGTLYRWSAPTTTGTLTGISVSSNVTSITGTLNNPGTTAETATFTVTPSTSCGDGASFTVVVTVYPIAVITPMSTTTCGGVSFTVSPTLGVDGNFPAGTKYSWSAPTPGITAFSGGQAGTLAASITGTLLNTVNAVRTATYTVTPTTLDGCVGAVFTVTVNINPTAQVTAMTNLICNGSSFTSIPVNITNNIVPAGTTYIWLAPTGSGFTGGMTGAGSSITGTLANSTSSAHTATYIVTPTTPANCTGATFTVTVTVNPIAAVTDMTATTCSGVTFNSIPQDLTNGTIPSGTLYAWNAPVAPGITGGASQLSAIGSITGLLTNTTIATAVAVYTVTPTSNGCTGAQFTLTVTVNPSAAVTPMSTTICGGSPFTVLPTNTTDGRVPPATTYSWLAVPTGVGFTGGATATGSANITGTLLNTTNAVRTATYLVTPLTGGCTGAVFSVTVNLNPLAQVTPMTTITCSGTAFNLSPVNLTNGIVPSGINYSWTVFSVTGGITGAVSGTSQPFITGTLLNPTSTQQTATYTVTPNTATCGNGSSFTVTVSVNPTATITSSLSATTCGGVAFSVTPTNVTDGNVPLGTRFAWALPTGTGFSGGASATNALAITGTILNTTSTVTTAFYSVNTVSGACAGAAFTVTITLNPKAIITQMTGTTCSGTFFAVTPTDITNGIVPNGTTYSWSTPTGSNLTGFATGSGQPDINGILINGVNVARTATYFVTPSSITGVCAGNVFSIVVTVNPRANITPMTTITCSGVSFAVSPTNLTNGIVPGATLYSWTSPSITGSLTGFTGSASTTFISGTLVNTSNVAQTATYTVTPTSACGNGPTFTVTVTVNPAAIVNTINTATCSGITFTVTPTNVTDGTVPSSTTYTWGVPTVTGGITGGAARGTASATVFGLLANPTNAVQTATYTVTPLSGNCTGAQFSVVVTLNPVATITAMTATICSGTSFTLTPQQTTNGIVPSGTTYQWSVPTGTSISGGASATGSASITGTLINTSNISRTATYTVIPTSGSCTSVAFTVTVTVDPTPTVPNFIGVPGCTGTVSLTPTGTLIPTNTTYTWGAPTGSGYTGGQSQLTASTNFHATIASTTNVAVTPTYLVTPISGSCQGAAFTVTINLAPSAIIIPMTTTTCSGVAFSVSPADGANGVVPAGTTYTWTALPTGTGFTGGLTQAGSTDINGTLTNNTNSAVTATYLVNPHTGTCTGATFSVTVTINPAAYITAMTAVTCTGTAFSVTPTNLFNGIVPAGTTYSWSAPSVTGTLTGGGAMTGATNITGTLSHTNITVQTATYIVTPTSAACGNNAAFTVTVTVNPLAAVTDMTTTACNGVAFSITPVNVVNGIVPGGTVYTWATPTGTGFTGGVSQVSAVTNISGILTNTTSSSTTVTYTVTPRTALCTGTAFSVVLTLNPSATVVSMTSTICSGATFTVTPSDVTNGIVPAGTTYSWNAPTATGITGGVTGSGAAFISGTLINTTSIARTITYTVTPLSGSCTGNVFTVTVTVDAKASVNQITSISSSNAIFTITPVDVTNGIVPAGTTYSWSAPLVTGGMTGGAAGSAATSISGTLFSPTNVAQTATYIVTPSSGNCTGAAFTVVISIYPVATVNALTVTTCSGVAFSITPTHPTNGTIPVGTVYRWGTPSGTGFTGGAAASSQTTIGGSLVNTTTAPVTATYLVTPTSAGFDGVPFTVTVTVNPNPVLSSTLTPTGVCSGSTFAYPVTSATAGSVFTWSRTTVTGITSGGGATGTGNISQTLSNSTTSPLTVNYVYGITANGCTNPSAGTVAIIVNPIPVLNSTLTPADIYNATVFNYTATSLTPGTTFAWSRAAVSAINSNTTGSGVGATISETLTTTNPSLTAVVYAITLTANGCVNAQTITVNVSPTPALSSPLNPAAICSGTVFGYTAISATPGTTFTWTRAAIASINSNTTGSGLTGTINETLTNSSNVPVSVVYTVLLTANTFTNTQNVTVVVNPTPIVNQPVGQSICNGFITSATVFSGSVAGAVYSWTNTFTSIGLAASGSGTINAFTATNTTTATITSVITVTPMSNSCAGAPAQFSITVYPTAVLSSTLSPTGICTGSAFSYTATSATTGTSFSWSRTTVTGITSGGAATGTGNVTGQSHINNTTAPISVQYVYTITANSCSNIQSVTLAVNPTPVLSSTLSPTAVFGGTTFVYTPTSVTTATTFTWSRAAITGISNAASSGTGTISESLINTTASPISVVYSYTSTAAGCATSQTVTVSIIPSNIDAVTDDFRAICIDGGKGGKTTTVLANDILNSTVVDPTLVNMSIVSNGGITGLTINSLGELVVPAKTFEGTYTITYNICVTANPGNCDQATATITVCRGLFITTTAVCRNDVPYVHYKVEANFTPATSSPVTLKWLNGDKSVLTAQPIVNGTALEADVLWPGAVVDSAGNPTDWPGWFISNGLWVAGADGFEGTRPNAYLVVSVNPTDTVLLSYPPATPACAVNPVNRRPIAVDDRDSTGQCSALVISVLNNDSDFEHGTLTVSLTSATSLHNGTAVVNANGTVTYTPPTNYEGVDKFTYTITDAAGLTASATVTITVASKPQIVGGISGICALAKDSSGIYSVLPVANATSYLWTLPSGWTGSSTTNKITAKAGTANGTITVVPYNGGCAGTAVNYNVSIIDYAKITLTASPSTVKGDGIATSQITIQLFDPNGNPIHCSGGTATLCTSSGVFSDVVDNGDGTYTGYLRSSANAAVICGTVAGKKIEQGITTTFTGPQGSIKGNGPIFETETPLLTFNFTAGIGPFTVIYKAQGATKTDTLTNVVSNVPIPVKSISATKLYTMVSIIGTDNARRDNNFTRDTATILVVAPKIVITLTADNPKFLADNLYSTILRLKVRNSGVIDLASVQVKANLLDVFPNPVQFVLDSVKQAGRQTVPNGRYDGRTNFDLFSWNFNSTPGLRNNMNDVAAVQVPAMAYGNGSNGYTASNTDGVADDRTQIPFLPGYHANAEKENTTGNTDGPLTTPFFFGALSKLDAGEESEMQMYVRIIPNGYFKPFLMQAVAVGTGHTEFGTALANSLSNDDGNESLHPENTHNGDPLPTVINVFPNPVLGVAMNASTPVLQSNGTYNVTLSYVLKNYGNVNLRQVKLFEDLRRSIGSPATFNVLGAPVTTGNLIANPGYDGKTDTSMLAANSSLGVSTDASVTFTINITPNQASALYRLFAIGTGFNNELGNTITDISSNGTNPDPDGNEIPDERLITLIPINMSIPPLVPGTIGIQDTPTTTVLTKVICGTSVITVIPAVAPTGGLDPYTFQWQSSVDNTTFIAIPGATGSTYTGTIAASVYLRRIVFSGSQQAYSNSVRVVINTIVKPVITASGGSLNLTNSGSITLTSSTASGYLWANSATTGSIVVTVPGPYTVIITDANGCKATSDLVTINPPPTATLTDIQKITSKAPQLQADGSYLVNFTIRATNLMAQQMDSVKIKDDLRAVFPTAVQFEVMGVKTSGKLIANELYNGNSQIELLADGSVLPANQKDSVILTVKVTPNGFSGQLKNTAIQTARSPYGVLSVISNDPTLSNGITSRAPTEFIIPATDIFIPSGFSPNRDGVNDVFVITRPFNTTINMEIYNRWGNLVYRSRDYKNDWGGKGNQPNNILGEDLPDGTYYYVVLATDNATGNVRKFAAFITLKR